MVYTIVCRHFSRFDFDFFFTDALRSVEWDWVLGRRCVVEFVRCTVLQCKGNHKLRDQLSCECYFCWDLLGSFDLVDERLKICVDDVKNFELVW